MKCTEKHHSQEFFKVMFHWPRKHLTKTKPKRPINIALLRKKKKNILNSDYADISWPTNYRPIKTIKM